MIITKWRNLSNEIRIRHDTNEIRIRPNTIRPNTIRMRYELDPNDLISQHISSKYYTQKQFKLFSSENMNHGFSLLHFNIRSLNKNFDNFRLLLDDIGPPPFSVIGLTETWITHNPTLFSIPGYNLEVNNRTHKPGGGVACYILDKYKYSVISELSLMNKIIESLFIEIENKQQKNIVIGIIYRPPNANPNSFLAAIQDILHNARLQNKDSFIMGDFNINLLNRINSSSLSQEFLNTFLSGSFLPLISRPTRLTETSATLIDNIFSNIHPPPQTGIIISDISDHFPVFAHSLHIFSTHSNSSNHNHIPFKYRHISTKNLNRLTVSLNNEEWTSVFNTNNVDESFENFMNIFTKHFDKCIPLCSNKKPKYKKNPRLPWISNSLLRSINKKNNLYYKYKANPSARNRNKYTRYKNILTKLIRYEKKSYYSKQLDHYKGDMQKTWKVINDVLDKAKKNKHITKIIHENKEIENFKEISEIFNTYFSRIGVELAKNIPTTNTSFQKYLTNPNPNSLFLFPTNTKELTQIVQNLQDKKSTGHDEIDNILVKKNNSTNC